MTEADSCSVLLADDDLSLWSSLSDVLEAKGHRVDTAHSGDDALAACRGFAYDVLLLDIGLPDLSSLEVIARVEEIRPELEILIITGHGSLDRAVHAVSRSTIGYLVKPIDLDRLLAILDGIASRKRVERENRVLAENIERSKQEWESTFNAISDPIAIVRAGGEVMRVNPAFCERFGTSMEGAVTARAGELIFTPQSRQAEARIRNAALDLGPVVEERSDLALEGVFAVSCNPAVFDRRRGVIYVLRDVTASRRADAEREALILQLERTNAELEQYAYTVSHDLKSPLITITGFLGLIERGVKSGDTGNLEADIARVSNAARRMKQLLDELLEISRIGRVVQEPEDVPLTEVAREAVDLIAEPAAERSVRFTFDRLPTVRADRTRILQVYQNLIENAVKFMGDQKKPRVDIGCRSESGEIVYFVSDNGIGIDPAYQEKVFGLFDKIVPESSGTGIGLALVKRIIEVHGGRIWVESEGGGKGSSFLFTLPGD